MNLSVIGLGKLGACSAAAFAAKGHKVIGVDLNPDYVAAINSGRAPVVEPLLQEYITKSSGRLRATQSFEEAMHESDMTFLIVPTPSQPDGHFSDKYLQDALSQLAPGLKKPGKGFHVFVITSTVSPGTTDKVLIPLIESVSGKKLNVDFGVSYNPEFIALGSVVRDFLNPDMLLIGESDKRTGDLVSAAYETSCDNRPYYARMSLISAEITKISLNSYITMKITFANTLADICEAIPGSQVDLITAALGADKRVSPYYLRGGLPFGGPCFPRDNRAFAAFAALHGIDALAAKTTDRLNEQYVEKIVKKVELTLKKSHANKLSILGLAYKPDTPVLEESASIKIVERLAAQSGIQMMVYDPVAMDTGRAALGSKVQYASSVRECMAFAPLCLITTQSKEFKEINSSCIAHNPTTVIDCWRLLDPAKFDGKIKHVPLGVFVGD